MSTLNREVIPDYGSHPVAEPCHPILLRAQEDRNCSGLGRKILEASKLRSKPLHDENGLKTFALVFEKGDEVRIRRHGNAVIIEPMNDDWAWLDAIAGTLDKDFVQATEEQPEAQERPEIDELFR